MNNLFDFATSELSQDAVICWCVNWFNDDSNPALKKMATEIIERIFRKIIEKTPDFTFSKIESVNIKRQLSKKVKDDGKDVAVRIDVLLIINKSIALIIEDKTNTSEHSKQIDRYRDGLKKMIAENAISKDELDPSNSTIKTVYWKTGFYNDYDRAVKANATFFRSEILSLLTPYRNENPILDDYVSYLESIDKIEEAQKQYWVVAEKWDSLWGKFPYLSNSHVGQYELLRSCFPLEENMIHEGRFYEPYQIYSGTSYGRPWTEMKIKYGFYSEQTKNNEPDYSIFWRVDTAKNGPYISLRLYDHRDRKQIDPAQKEQHEKLYGEFCDKITKIINESGKSLIEERELSKRDNKKYKESSFFSWNIAKELEINNADQTHLIETIRHINEEFLNRIEKDK